MGCGAGLRAKYKVASSGGTLSSVAATASRASRPNEIESPRLDRTGPVYRPLALNLGLRYARSRRSFIAFVSAVAVGGLALSVAVLLFVQGVIAGFERELEQRVLRLVPQLTVLGRTPLGAPESVIAELETIDGVDTAVPIISGPALAATAERVAGIQLTGIDPERHSHVSIMHRFVDGDALGRLVERGYGVLLGSRLAERLGVAQGDPVTLVLPDATVTPVGVLPRTKRFRVIGIVNTQSELDARAAYVHIRDAARLFRLGDAVHGIQVRVDDLFQAQDTARRVVDALGASAFYARTWFATHGNLYNAVVVQKRVMFLLLSLLVAVAAFNMVSSLVMVVKEREGDVAILRTLGSSSGMIMAAFVVLGSLVGALGTALGIAIGLGLGYLAASGYGWLQTRFELELMAQYFVNTLPVAFSVADIARVATIALLLCILSTLYPAWRAVRMQPADVLQHE